MIPITVTDRLVDVFAAAGVEAAEQGVLPDALAELAVRLDIKGCGPLLDEMLGTCWEPEHTHERCPTCGARAKRPPQPHPKPAPAPQPKPAPAPKPGR